MAENTKEQAATQQEEKEEDAKKKPWDVTGEEGEFKIVGRGKLEKFAFEVVREKDVETKLEKLLIGAKHGEEDYGQLVTTIGRLKSDILKLVDYGINLTLGEFRALAKVIEENFYSLPRHNVRVPDTLTDEKLEEVLEFVRKYIGEEDIEDKDGCYNLPSADFTKAYDESDFKLVDHLDLTKVKWKLKEKKYLVCNKYRADHTVKIEGKPVKCISFKKAIIRKQKNGGEK